MVGYEQLVQRFYGNVYVFGESNIIVIICFMFILFLLYDWGNLDGSAVINWVVLG